MSLLRKLLMQKKKEEYIIEYTSTDGNIVEPSDTTTPFLDADGKNIKIISNTYKNGKGIIKLEKECYQIAKNAFSNKSMLKSILIPDSVTIIAQNAFVSCYRMTDINIPNKLLSIGINSFYGCQALINIEFPITINSIDMMAFYGCSSLSAITILRETPPTLGSYAFLSIASDAKFYVPSGSVDAYKSATNWSDYADKIQAIS